MAKTKNVNTTNLSHNYGHMNLADFETNLKKLGFTGDFKKAHAKLADEIKKEKELKAKKA